MSLCSGSGLMHSRRSPLSHCEGVLSGFHSLRGGGCMAVWLWGVGVGSGGMLYWKNALGAFSDL